MMSFLRRNTLSNIIDKKKQDLHSEWKWSLATTKNFFFLSCTRSFFLRNVLLASQIVFLPVCVLLILSIIFRRSQLHWDSKIIYYETTRTAMTTSSKRQRQRKSKVIRRWYEHRLTWFFADKNQLLPTVNCYDSSDLTTDHDYIAPHEKYDYAIGLFSVFLNRQIIDMSFTKLYQQRWRSGGFHHPIPIWMFV